MASASETRTGPKVQPPTFRPSDVRPSSKRRLYTSAPAQLGCPRANPRRGPAFQSTRPARGATKHSSRITLNYQSVSIHAPRAGRDQYRRTIDHAGFKFQSTRPARGATVALQHAHARYSGFNPRAPRGARRSRLSADQATTRFQSTRPARGATTASVMSTPQVAIVSIHAPRAGRDSNRTMIVCRRLSFQSTRPARGATRRRSQGHVGG